MKFNKINLGCGKAIRSDCLNIDRQFAKGVDIVCDIGKERLPFDDNTIEKVYSTSFIEHLSTEEMAYLCEELYRVCKPNAEIMHIAPYYLSPSSCRVWHKQRVSEGFFDDYNADSDYESLDTKKYFKIDYELKYMRYTPKRKGILRLIPFLMIIPYEIVFTLKVIKNKNERDR
jgi:predicted SAM-dependent methyltransferase